MLRLSGPIAVEVPDRLMESRTCAGVKGGKESVRGCDLRSCLAGRREDRCLR